MDFGDYLSRRNADTGAFPRYRVTVNAGGEPEHHYLFREEELRALQEKMEASTGQQLEIFTDTGGGGSRSGAPGFRLVEIFSALPLAKLMAALERKGLDAAQLSPSATPLYTLTNGDENPAPIHSLREMLEAVRALGRKGLSIQRYKGLGEMNPEQLFETTMNPDKRKLLKVMVEDAVRTNEIFNILMGDEVEPRRLFIEANALNVQNLDI